MFSRKIPILITLVIYRWNHRYGWKIRQLHQAQLIFVVAHIPLISCSHVKSMREASSILPLCPKQKHRLFGCTAVYRQVLCRFPPLPKIIHLPDILFLDDIFDYLFGYHHRHYGSLFWRRTCNEVIMKQVWSTKVS